MANLLKIASKKIQREQEKLMQKFGKPTEQSDEEYNEHLENFAKQQKHAERLLKETQNYLKALNGMVLANKQLGEAIKVVYEPDWAESDSIYKAVEEIDLMYGDIHDKLEKHVAEPLGSYFQRFPDIRARIAKRDRKHLDYSSAKRTVEAAREKGGPKLAPAEEAFAETEKTYNEINTELHEMLPNFYQGRMSFYSSIMQTMFSENANFHKSCEKINEQLRASMDRFLEVESSGLHTSKPITTRMPSKAKGKAPEPSTGGSSTSVATPAAAQPAAADNDDEPSEAVFTKPIDKSATPVPAPRPQTLAPAPAPPKEATPAHAAPVVAPAATPVAAATATDHAAPTPAPTPAAAAPATDEAASGAGEVLEKRVATHSYDATDDDELTFVKGDLIDVLKHPDEEEELDDGWLYGRLNNRVGVFPKNFTAEPPA